MFAVVADYMATSSGVVNYFLHVFIGAPSTQWRPVGKPGKVSTFRAKQAKGRRRYETQFRRTMFWPRSISDISSTFLCYIHHTWFKRKHVQLKKIHHSLVTHLSETLMKMCVRTLRFWWNASSETSKEPSNSHSAIHQEPLDVGSCCRAPCHHFVLDLKWTIQFIANSVLLRLQHPEQESAPQIITSDCDDAF